MGVKSKKEGIAQELILSEQFKFEIENGKKSLNQIRKQYGLKPIKDGDMLYYSKNEGRV